MNRDEKIAFKFLQKHFSKKPNQPPDFELNSREAFEVRRLNQNYFEENVAEGLEEVSIPLQLAIREVLDSFKDKFDGRTFGVLFNFERPISDFHAIKNTLKTKLINFLENTWVIGSLVENISYCISEKSQKIKKRYKSYSKWTLLLVNRIPFFLLK